MSRVQLCVMIGIAALVTCAVRFAPFLICSGKRKAPPFVQWLGARLPRAVMLMILVYCLKDLSFSSAAAWLPAVLGVAATALLHLWKRQMILSISAGTAVYMLLTRLLA